MFPMTVKIIENFIEPEVCRYIVNHSKCFLSNENGKPGYFEDNYPRRAISKDQKDFSTDPRVSTTEEGWADRLISDCLYKAQKYLEDFYSLKSLDNYEGCLVKLTQGAHNGLHSDMFQIDGSKWNDGTGREDEKPYSALLYLSSYEEDFFGGEIIFPQHDLTVYPKAGDFVFFIGDLDHLHEVNEITSGERYAIIMFFGE